jgi:hypothetical protein
MTKPMLKTKSIQINRKLKNQTMTVLSHGGQKTYIEYMYKQSGDKGHRASNCSLDFSCLDFRACGVMNYPRTVCQIPSSLGLNLLKIKIQVY